MNNQILEKECEKYIIEHELINKTRPVVVGLSGGADSMVLAHVLLKLNYTIIAAHCNFHLRNDASDADEQMVREWCKMHNVPCKVAQFDTFAYARDNSMSIEMAARELRYNWFNEILVSQNGLSVAVAHHLNDHVETFFINITRGTGISGLKGILPRNGNVVRPLLFASRSMIEEYAQANEIHYRNDHTNSDTSIMRNYVRHEIVPRFEHINPSFLSTMNRNMGLVSNVVKFLEKQFELMEQEIVSQTEQGFLIGLPKSELAFIFPDFLHHLFNKNEVDVDILAVTDLLDSQVGRQVVSEKWQAIRARNGLLISELQEAVPQNVTISSLPAEAVYGNLRFILDIIEDFNPSQMPKDSNAVWLDADKVNLPITIRNWEAGDTMVPFGMSGQRKIKKMLTDAEIIGQKRTTYPVVCNQSSIIWLPYIRPDNRYAVTDSTKRVVLIVSEDFIP